MYEHQVCPAHSPYAGTWVRHRAGQLLIDSLLRNRGRIPSLPCLDGPTAPVITRGISRKSRLVVYDNQSAGILDNKGSVPKDRSLSVIIRVAALEFVDKPLLRFLF